MKREKAERTVSQVIRLRTTSSGYNKALLAAPAMPAAANTGSGVRAPFACSRPCTDSAQVERTFMSNPCILEVWC